MLGMTGMTDLHHIDVDVVAPVVAQAGYPLKVGSLQGGACMQRGGKGGTGEGVANTNSTVKPMQ